MAISADGAASKAIALITAQFGPAADPDMQMAMVKAICQGVIEEIQANAVVSGQVTSGAGAGGTVTGTVS